MHQLVHLLPLPSSTKLVLMWLVHRLGDNVRGTNGIHRWLRLVPWVLGVLQSETTTYYHLCQWPTVSTFTRTLKVIRRAGDPSIIVYMLHNHAGCAPRWQTQTWSKGYNQWLQMQLDPLVSLLCTKTKTWPHLSVPCILPRLVWTV